ncbi:MAG: dual specificity protein phosphatase family protein [Anaerolineae bacterium]|nr:dual specificity protein phosphatase family protein [Anaerolineae bacterium]
MLEIYPNLFIGSEQDYEFGVKGNPGWVIVHACKYPYHKKELGYTGRAAPNTHPEYLIARREGRLILNLVDAPNPMYIPKEIIDAAIEYIHENLNNSKKVLVHCNLGESRSPSIGLLYLAIFTDKVSKEFSEAEKDFREIYPSYNPGLGMRGFMIKNWEAYVGKSENKNE